MDTRERNALKISQLQPQVRWAAKEWEEACWAKDYPFKISEAYRSRTRQFQLWLKGRMGSAARRVTWTLNSKHTRRLALDVYPLTKKENFYETLEFVGKRYGITHPLTMRPYYDFAHFEFTEVGPRPIEPSQDGAKTIHQRTLQRRLARLEGRPRERALKRILRRFPWFT